MSPVPPSPTGSCLAPWWGLWVQCVLGTVPQRVLSPPSHPSSSCPLCPIPSLLSHPCPLLSPPSPPAQPSLCGTAAHAGTLELSCPIPVSPRSHPVPTSSPVPPVPRPVPSVPSDAPCPALPVPSCPSCPTLPVPSSPSIPSVPPLLSHPSGPIPSLLSPPSPPCPHPSCRTQLTLAPWSFSVPSIPPGHTGGPSLRRGPTSRRRNEGPPA